MQREKSQHPSDDRPSSHLYLLKEAAAGRFDGLKCPQCYHKAISVWFTHPTSDVYRTWFICADCDFHTRAQNTERPRFFSDDRVSADLEERDLAIVRQTIFKRPPGGRM